MDIESGDGDLLIAKQLTLRLYKHVILTNDGSEELQSLKTAISNFASLIDRVIKGPESHNLSLIQAYETERVIVTKALKEPIAILEDLGRVYQKLIYLDTLQTREQKLMT